MDMKNFARISVSKSQGEGKQKVNVKAFAFYGALTIGFAGVLGTMLVGCNNGGNTEPPANLTEPSSPPVSDKATAVTTTESSVTWEEQDTYNENTYRDYLTNLIKSYDKNADSATVKEVVDFAVQLREFTTHANADIQSKSDVEIDKDLLILSNKAEEVLSNGNKEVKSAIKTNHITDNLMSLSEQLKVCKVLSASPIDLVEGSSKHIEVKAQPSNAVLKLKYVSSNDKIATVDSKGTVKGVSKGVAVITVTDEATQVATKIKLTVKEKVANKTTASTSTNTNKTSSDSGNKGESKNTSKPAATTSKPKSDTPKVVPITSLSLPKSSLQLRVGESVSLEPGVMPSNATERSLVAHYSNSNIAYYDGHTVTANGVGSSTVGISTEDGRYRVDIEVVVSGNSGNSGNSSNGGNSGSTSKPSSNTSKPSGTQNNGGSSSKPSGTQNSGGSSSKPSSTSKPSSDNSSKPSNNSKPSSNSTQSSTAKKWIASEHVKDAVKTRDGHTVYECPEIVPYLNYYRRQAGLPDVTFFGSEEWKVQSKEYWEDLLKSPNYREGIKEDFPDCVNPDGTVNVDKIIEENLRDDGYCGVIDNLEYSINHHVSYHETDYGEGVAECNGDRIGYDPQQWILDFKSSPAHWEYLMRPDLRFIYAAYSHETEDGFTLMIG